MPGFSAGRFAGGGIWCARVICAAARAWGRRQRTDAREFIEANYCRLETEAPTPFLLGFFAYL